MDASAGGAYGAGREEGMKEQAGKLEKARGAVDNAALDEAWRRALLGDVELLDALPPGALTAADVVKMLGLHPERVYAFMDARERSGLVRRRRVRLRTGGRAFVIWELTQAGKESRGENGQISRGNGPTRREWRKDG